MSAKIKNSGLSVLAVVLSMLILSLFAAVGVSVITTQSSVGLGEEQGLQAFYIADGGLQYALNYGDLNPCNLNTPTLRLGEGEFFVNSVYVSNSISGYLDLTNATVTLTAMPAPGFENKGFSNGVIAIDGGGEEREYLFCNDILSNSFIQCQRGYSGTTAVIHNGVMGSRASQCTARSTGTVSKGLLFGSTKRVVEATVGY